MKLESLEFHLFSLSKAAPRITRLLQLVRYKYFLNCKKIYLEMLLIGWRSMNGDSQFRKYEELTNT